MSGVPTLKWPPRIFYGWYVAGIAMLGAFLSAGSSQMFMSIMLKPMTEDLGWTRTEMTGAITAGTFLAGFIAPPFGRLADRYGPRVLTAVGGLLVVGLYLALANVTELWHFYVAYILGRSVSHNTLTGVVPMTAAANWFRRMRGRVLGFVSMSIPLGGSVLAFVGQLIMEEHGWRAVFITWGAVMLVVLVPAAALFLRRRPEDMGLLPDGEEVVPSGGLASGRKAREEEFSWTLGEAKRTPALWLLIAALTIIVMANTSVSFHQVAYYTDVGLAATAAVVALSVYAFCGALASGIWGFLTERFSERYLAVIGALLAGSSMVFLLFVRNPVEALIFAVWFGLTSRGEGALVNIILAQYYGRNSYGSINGFTNPFFMVGLGLGPLISSVTFDLLGSYRLVFAFFAGVSFVAAGLLWLAKKPPLPPRAYAGREQSVAGGRQ